MTTEETTGGPTATAKIVNRGPGLVVVAFVFMFATGNCEFCGGDRDYVGDAIDALGEGD